LYRDPLLEIDRYGFFGTDTDISAIHGPITDISKILKSCFLLHYQKCYVFYALPFFQKLQKSGFEPKFFKLQQFQYFARIFS